ncbi:SagB/ThcOx family dehydrogenase [Thermococcus sp.]
MRFYLRQKKRMTLNEFLEKEFPIAVALISFNTNLIVSPYAEQTVVKNPETCLRGSLYSKTRLLLEYYLLNNRAPKESFVEDMGVGEYRDPDAILSLACRDLNETMITEDHVIPLPKPKRISAPLGGAIVGRRSVRDYSGDPIELEDLSSILYHADGISGKLPVTGIELESTIVGSNPEIKTRTAPSGGGLYPIDIYVIAINVKNLEEGIYLYMPYSHALKLIKRMKDEDFSEITYADIDTSKLGVMLVFVYNIYRNARKYGDAALAYALIEVGEISQNVHLSSISLGYGSCDIGAYYKHKIEKLLEIDGIFSHAVHVIFIGVERR